METLYSSCRLEDCYLTIYIFIRDSRGFDPICNEMRPPSTPALQCWPTAGVALVYRCILPCHNSPHYSSKLMNLEPIENTTVALRQVTGSSSLVYTSATTVYLPCGPKLAPELFVQRPGLRLGSGETYRRYLSWEAENLLNVDISLLDRTLELNVCDLFAEVRPGADQLDEAVLDGEEDVSALLDVLRSFALGLDDEVMSAGTVLAYMSSVWTCCSAACPRSRQCLSANVRLWRVWCEKDFFDSQDVIVVVRSAVFKRGVAGNFEIVAEN
jgi:hypothetical protein